MKDKKMPLQVKLEDVVNLTLGGGGSKGFAHIGALMALEELKFDLKQIRRVSGSSAGAIVAGLLCCGYNPKELEKLFREMNFSDFLDAYEGSIMQTKDQAVKDAKQASHFFQPSQASNAASAAASGGSKLASEGSTSVLNLGSGFGLFKGELFRKWLEEKIKAKTNATYLTFGELHDLVIKKPDTYKDLYVTGVSVNTQVVNIFSWETTPNVIVSDAIRMSMSLPFIFMPHQPYIKTKPTQIKTAVPQIKGAFDPHSKRELGEDKNLYVDGGLLTNVPTNVFDFEKYLSPDIPKPGEGLTKHTNFKTLTFRLVSVDNKPKLEEGLPVVNGEINHILGYIKALLETIYAKSESDFRLDEEAQRTIYLGVNVSTFALKLSDIQKDALLNAGKESVLHEFGKTKSLSLV